MPVKMNSVTNLFEKYKDVYTAKDSGGAYKAMNKSQLRKAAYNKVRTDFSETKIEKIKGAENFFGRCVL